MAEADVEAEAEAAPSRSSRTNIRGCVDASRATATEKAVQRTTAHATATSLEEINMDKRGYGGGGGGREKQSKNATEGSTNAHFEI